MCALVSLSAQWTTISCADHFPGAGFHLRASGGTLASARLSSVGPRSEEHTSELQSRENLVCRLLLEKKKRSSPVGRCSPVSRWRIARRAIHRRGGGG